MTRRQVTVPLAILVRALTQGAPAREPFQARPITQVASLPPGGAAALTARPLAAAMARVPKDPVGVVKEAGAAGAVTMSCAAHGTPGGCTLLLGLSGISIPPEADRLFDRKRAYTMDRLTPVAYLDAPEFPRVRDRDAKMLAEAVRRVGRSEGRT